MASLPIKNCIEYWEKTLFHDKFLMSPSTQVIVEATVNHLKELERLEEKTDVKPNTT